MKNKNKNLSKLILAGASIGIPIAISEVTGLTNELMDLHTLVYEVLDQVSSFGCAIKPEGYLLRGICDSYVGIAGLSATLLVKEGIKGNLG